MPSMTGSVFVRKPTRRYPLPQNLKELDNPWAGANENRYARVDRFQEGYTIDSGDNPMITPPSGSKSNILSKL